MSRSIPGRPFPPSYADWWRNKRPSSSASAVGKPTRSRCATNVLAGAGDGVIYIVRTRTADSTGEPLTWTVVRNITPKGHWVRLDEVYGAKDRDRLPGEILTQLADDLQLDDTTAVRKAGYFVGINAYATDNFMLFDDSIRFVYVPGEIAPKAVNITLDR